MSRSSDCLSESIQRAFVLGTLSEEETQQVDQHVQGCKPCQLALQRLRDTVRRSDLDPSAAEEEDQTIDIPLPIEATESALSEGLKLAIMRMVTASDYPDSFGRLKGYELVAFLGRGGYGIVFEAVDPVLNRRVAIKILSPELATKATARRRFIREARSAAAINHPHVVTVFGVDESAHIPFLVMELLTGRSLRERCRREPKLELIQVLQISMQVAQGLAAAHAQGIIHRDVKPGNILLVDNIPRVKITDFGLARVTVEDLELTSHGVTVGTPGFMSPEQVRGEKLDARSDLFALGCVIYAMFTGHSPFHGKSILEVARRVETYDPPRLRTLEPQVPEFLDEMVYRLLQKNPERRYQSAAEFADVLQRHLAILNQTPTDRLPDLYAQRVLETQTLDGHPRQLRTLSRRSGWLVAGLLVASVMVLLGAGSLATWLGYGPLAVPAGIEASRPRLDHVDESGRLADSVDEKEPNGVSSGRRQVDDPGANGAPRDASQSPQGAAHSGETAATTLPGEAQVRVSQTGTGDCRTLQEALQRIATGGTIEVLDTAEYVEPLQLVDPQRLAGVRLIAKQRAVLRSEKAGSVLSIRGIPRLQIRGFQLVAQQSQIAIDIEGNCPGLVLDDILIQRTENRPPSELNNAAIALLSGTRGTELEPIRLQNIQIRGTQVGLVLGRMSDESTPISHVEWLNGRIQGSTRQRTTLMAIVNDVEQVTVRNSIFWNGGVGLSVRVREGAQASDRQWRFEHNTWFDLSSWIVWTGPISEDSGLTWRRNLLVNTTAMAPAVRSLAAQFPDTFAENIGIFLDPAVNIPVGANLEPAVRIRNGWRLQSLDPTDAHFLQPDANHIPATELLEPPPGYQSHSNRD
jgi:serine/threonine protein kinase